MDNNILLKCTTTDLVRATTFSSKEGERIAKTLNTMSEGWAYNDNNHCVVQYDDNDLVLQYVRYG